jgi:hypothetical protein
VALDFSEAALRQLAGGTVRQAILFRIDNPDPEKIVRMWASVGDYQIGVDPIETEVNAKFHGIGQMIDVPVVNQLLNGVADRVDFTLSGAVVRPDIVNMVSIEAGEVEFQRCNLGIQVMGDDWQPISEVGWLWEGEVGPVAGEKTASSEGAQHSISLSVGSVFTARRRPKIINFTDTHQQRFSPGDLFCNRTALYSIGSTIKWP